MNELTQSVLSIGLLDSQRHTFFINLFQNVLIELLPCDFFLSEPSNVVHDLLNVLICEVEFHQLRNLFQIIKVKGLLFLKVDQVEHRSSSFTIKWVA